MHKNKTSVTVVFLVILIGLNILAWLAVYDLSNRKFEVIFFDIGQGDSALIKTPRGHYILIDGGPGPVILEKLAKEMPFWDRSLDLIILTHPEHDHIGGLIEVLKSYKVERILWTGIIRNTFEYKEWKELIKNEKANIFIAHKNQKIKAGSVIIDVLHPFQSLAGMEFENSNDTSIVNKVRFGKTSFLFTGDISESVEKQLLTDSASLAANVLKVGHHGSKTSSSEEFIKAVLPDIAVISVGRNNRYGHPHDQVLKTLANYNIIPLRTDVNGNIKVFSNGENLQVITEFK
jgi:competence protein ComEC